MIEEISSINRRDFLKLKFLLLLYTYFSQLFGINLITNNDTTIDYTILDKLLKLPFSKTVKKELKLRVALQKKYCYSSNGNLNKLGRFLREIANFIIVNANFNDFKLLYSIKDEQIDYGYVLNSTAKHNQVQSMKYLQQNLLGISNNMLSDAMIYAIRSNSVHTTTCLLQQKIKLDDQVVDEAIKIFQKEENNIFYKKISGLDNIKLLPSFNNINISNIRRMAKLTYNISEYITSEILKDIVYNCLVDMYNLHYIDDFTAEIYHEKLDIQVWNHDNCYIVNFLQEFEKLLMLNGFENFMQDYLDQDEQDIQLSSAFYENNNQNINYYDFINLNIL